MKVELVDDISQWKRWWSLRWILVSAFCSSAIGAYILLPAEFLPQIPTWVKQALASGAILSAGAAGVARVVKQTNGH